MCDKQNYRESYTGSSVNTVFKLFDYCNYILGGNMNKRIKKKKKKQLLQWIAKNYDFYDEKTEEYRTIPVKCYSCQCFESGDSSVGLLSSCVTPELYDENDDYIETGKVAKAVAEHMGNLGYGCPYYRKIKARINSSWKAV